METCSALSCVAGIRLCPSPLSYHRRNNSAVSFSLRISVRAQISATKATNAISEKSSLQQNNDNAVVDFLMSRCGFEAEDVGILRRRSTKIFKMRTTSRAEAALQLFKEYGLSDEQVRKIILASSSVISYKAEENLRPKLQLLKSIGLTPQELGDTVSHPRVLTKSFDKGLSLNIEYLEALFRGKSNLVQVLKKDPKILSCNVDTISGVIGVLKESEIHEDDIFGLITSTPTILRRSVDSIRARVEYARKLGVLTNLKSFVRMLKSLHRYRPEVLDEKIRVYGELGLDEEDVREILRKCPHVLANSSDKVRRNARYLLDVAGVSLGDLVKYPQVLNLSLETRIRPRHEVFNHLVEKGGLNFKLCLVNYLCVSEKRFLATYVNSIQDHRLQQEILGIYRGSLQKASDLKD